MTTSASPPLSGPPADPHGPSALALRILLVVSLMMVLSMGVRATFGIFMTPMLAHHGWSRESFSTMFAVQNLAWGVGAIGMGILGDRWGAVRAVAAAGALYAIGMAGTVVADGPAALMLWAGVLVGLGQGGTTSALLLPVVARVCPPAFRSKAMGIANAGGSLGQFAVVPAGHLLIAAFDWQVAMAVMALGVAAIVPMARALRDRGAASPLPATAGATATGATATGATATGAAATGAAATGAPAAGTPAPHARGHASGSATAARGGATAPDAGAPTLRAALRQAIAHPSFRRLAASYFVCGFQLAFVTLHLPSFVLDRGLSAAHGATAIALIGLFNVFGSYMAGHLGGLYSKRMLLGWVYGLRAVFVGVLLAAPLTPLTLYLFAAGTGLLWLSTVPLTMGLVGQVFGLRWSATLGGMVFMSHQVGAAVGVWLAGWSFARSGSYDTMWIACVALAIGAALTAWRVDERPAIAAHQPA